jgi:hypothetical protein
MIDDARNHEREDCNAEVENTSASHTAARFACLIYHSSDLTVVTQESE